MDTKTDKIKLSICCVTYNHEKFIKQALDSFLMQKTNFKYEVLIHDDASTDRTQEIVLEYAERYPEIIKPILQNENKVSKGIPVCREYIWPRINGEYVAVCDGDDFWTDENKLQKQVDFLDKNKDFTICFHPCKMVWENGEKLDSIWPGEEEHFKKEVLSIDDLLILNFIPSNSVVYRWQLKGKEDSFPSGIFPGDWFVHLLNAKNGKIGFVSDVMSVYRRQPGGVCFGMDTDTGESEDWIIKRTIPHIRFYREVEKAFHKDFTEKKAFLVRRCCEIARERRDTKKIKELKKAFPMEYRKCFPIFSDIRVSRLKKLSYVFLVMILILIIWFGPENVLHLLGK